VPIVFASLCSQAWRTCTPVTTSYLSGPKASPHAFALIRQDQHREEHQFSIRDWSSSCWSVSSGASGPSRCTFGRRVVTYRSLGQDQTSVRQLACSAPREFDAAFNKFNGLVDFRWNGWSSHESEENIKEGNCSESSIRKLWIVCRRGRPRASLLNRTHC
jgi:hypothetical protein